MLSFLTNYAILLCCIFLSIMFLKGTNYASYMTNYSHIKIDELVSKEKILSAAAEDGYIKTTCLQALDHHIGSSSSCDCHHCNLIISVDTPSAFNKYRNHRSQYQG